MFGLWSEHVAVGLAEWEGWLLDASVGFVRLASGVALHRRLQGAGTLLVVTAFVWWLGNVVPDAVVLHRGVLAVAVWTFPGPRRRVLAGPGCRRRRGRAGGPGAGACSDSATAVFGVVPR